MKDFQVVYTNAPWRNRTFKVRGVCENDVLNPCWDNRPSDVPGLFWGEPGTHSCAACAKEAAKTSRKF